jgi:hypothetical protein
VNDSPAPPAPLGNTTEIAGGDYEETGTAALLKLNLDGGDLVIDGSLTVTGPLEMSGGYLEIFGTLTVTGAMTWTGGTIEGPGTLNVQGGATLGIGTSAVTEDLLGVALENSGKITVTDQNVFYQAEGATVNNPILSTIDFDGNSRWEGDGTGTLNNQGRIEQTAATGTSEIYAVALVNDGAVTVSSGGTLDLNT